MKKYLAPEIAVSLFDSESVLTQASAPGVTSAFDEAKSRMQGMQQNQGTLHTFTVNLLF